MDPYRQWSQGRDLPLFSTPWWLDASCGPDGWSAAMAWDEHGQPLAAWPFRYRRTLGIGRITLPPLTPWTSLWVQPADHPKGYRNRSHVRQALADLLIALPPHALCHTAFYPEVPVTLPFQARGFRHRMHYSCTITDLSDKDSLWAQVNYNARNHIARAGEVCSVDTSMHPDEFLAFHLRTWKDRGRTPRIDHNAYRALAPAILERGQGRIYQAVDAQGRTHAALFVVWDSRMADIWQMGSDPHLRRSGALPLLFWTALADQVGSGRWFDFEGGMVEENERAFSDMGAEPRPLHVLTRTGHPLWDTWSLWTGKSYHG